MNSFHFNGTRHRAQREPGSDRVRVDDALVTVQQDGTGRFVAHVDRRSERLHAIADGDLVWVHWRGRTWTLECIDPTRASAASGTEAAGTAQAPMPGVVVSLLVAAGQTVAEGDALVLIESMKLQTTICAAAGGVVAELPFAVGQTFQRGAVLARLRVMEAAA
jgi:acetyl/propionyl-CoA carboxylase alpha subunit